MIREAEERDVEAICDLLETAFRRPDEAQLFRALRDGDDLALALVSVGSAPENPATAGAFGVTTDSSSPPGRRRDHGASAERAKPQAAGQLLGIAVLSHLLSPENCVGLGPLAVDSGHSDRGIGKALIGECVERARRAGYGAIFVLGQPPYYTRFGFSVEAARPFRSEYPADYLMALELSPGALAGGGELRYAPAFAGL